MMNSYIYAFDDQDYGVDWTMLLNMQMFPGNLAVALIFGGLRITVCSIPKALLEEVS